MRGSLVMERGRRVLISDGLRGDCVVLCCTEGEWKYYYSSFRPTTIIAMVGPGLGKHTDVSQGKLSFNVNGVIRDIISILETVLTNIIIK